MWRSNHRMVVVLAALVGCGDSSSSWDETEQGTGQGTGDDAPDDPAEDDAADGEDVEPCHDDTPSIPTSELAPLNVGRERHSVTQLANGDVMVVGGNPCLDPNSRLASVERYAVASQAWEEVAPLNVPRGTHATIALPDGDMLVLGGTVTGGWTDSVERYIADEDRWIEVGTLPQSVADPQALLLASGTTIILGAATPGLWTRSDDDGATWQELDEPGLASVGVFLPLVLLPDGDVLATSVFNTHIYHPNIDTWSPGPQAEGVAQVSETEYLVMQTQALPHQDPYGTGAERPVGYLWDGDDELGEWIDFASCNGFGPRPFVQAMYGGDQNAAVVTVSSARARWKRATGWEWLSLPQKGAGALLRDGSFMLAGGEDSEAQTCTAVRLAPP